MAEKKDPRQVAREEEEARQAKIVAAVEQRNAEIIAGADPDRSNDEVTVTGPNTQKKA